MNRLKFLEQLDAEWDAFKRSFVGLSDDDIVEPVIGSWSTRDLIGHVATWDGECVKSARLKIDGKDDLEYEEGFNDEQVVEKRELSMRALMKDLEDSHRLVQSFIETAPEQSLSQETSVGSLIHGETYLHYAEHGKSIRDWRAQHGK